MENMKTCHSCSTEKNLTEFNKNKARKDGYASTCRSCMKSYRKTHYDNNKVKVIDAVKTRQKLILDMVWEYKKKSECVECGLSDPRVLDFDHLRDKEFSISRMAISGYSWDRILKEIEKCEMVCANHHRIRTFERAGWRS